MAEPDPAPAPEESRRIPDASAAPARFEDLPPAPAGLRGLEVPPEAPRGRPFEPGNTAGKKFEPGQSGNPAGRQKGKKVQELEDLARSYVDTVMNVWASIVLDKTASHRDKIRAGEMLAAYGMGKPRQAITVSGEEGKPPVLVDSVTQMLERIIKVGPGAAGALALPPLSGGAAGDAPPRGPDDAPESPSSPGDTTNGETP